MPREAHRGVSGLTPYLPVCLRAVSAVHLCPKVKSCPKAGRWLMLGTRLSAAVDGGVTTHHNQLPKPRI